MRNTGERWPPPGRRRAPALLLLTALGLGWLLVACGSAPESAETASTASGVVGQVCCVAAPADQPEEIGGIATAHNGWDIVLLNWMAPHDAVAGQMAALAPTRSANDAVRQLAATIEQEGQPRYLQLVAMATAWDQPVPSTDPADAAGHDHGGGPSDLDSAAVLGPLSGVDFDRQFLTIMIAHHEAALPVAAGAVTNGENPQNKQLAQQISTSTSAEIAQMHNLLAQL